MTSESDGSQEVDSKQAWAIILGFVAFFVGMAIFANHSRILGGVFMGVPVASLVVSIVRTPRDDWRRLATEVAHQKRERESRPRTGWIWWILHRLGNVIGILGLLLLVAIVFYAIAI